MGRISTIKRRSLVLEFKSTSLDFPCEFCQSNSYENFHFHIGGDLYNICEKCLSKAKELTNGK